MPFEKILVANRGEIAIRIFRAATELGLKTVAVYSDEDRLSLHRYKADEAWLIGEKGKPLDAYLDMDAIIALAQKRGVDAIHPGYGFLSENAEFARRCEKAGVVFVGPPASAIDKLGDKVSARNLAIEANVPVIPGSDGPVANVADAVKFAATAGFPIMVKASHGGGGRGMRRVTNNDELKAGFEAAQREAKQAFGNDEIFLEKFLVQPRHIEVQVLGDHGGGCVHLFERDCSVQRRHQKVVEVAPAVGISDELREILYANALTISKAAGLANAATVEFLVDTDENHYFIEVNPRLQVEHTITEMITGIDIVQAQLRIAEGATLTDLGFGEQSQISRRGHAIQARITTEDPGRNFAPDTGRVTAYRSAAGLGIRLDVSIGGAGAVVTPFYDSLLVKVSAHALSHDEAARKLSRSLMEFRIRGVSTNIPFIQNIVNHNAFRQGKLDTGFVERTKELFVFPRRRNRATRVLYGLGDTIVNGPPGVDRHLSRPQVRITPTLPSRLEELRAATNFKKILDEEGPEAVARAVLAEKTLLFTDTTFRDAHQSLLATRARTHDMARVAAATEDRLRGSFSVECWGGATFDVAYRFLREDPWERLAKLRKKMPNTLLQMLLRGSNAVGYANYPKNVIRRFVQLAADTGVDVFRIFDCFNQLDAMRVSIDEVRAAGKIAEVSICFSGDLNDPSRSLYTLDYYKRKAEEFTKAGAHMLAIKDMAGLLRPNQAPELVRAIKEVSGLPVHLHTHDTSGNGVAMLLEASKAGVDVVDAAMASMSGLTSQPSLDAVLASLKDDERSPNLDVNELQELSDYWEAVRTWYLPFESGLRASTTDVYRHEIPGGQYSNLKPQAFAVGLAEQWAEVRERYREVNFAFGDVIKVTPSSKVVGDFALWLVRQNLTVSALMESSTAYDFPQSLIDFMNGAIGVPEGGFPEALRARILGPDAGPAPDKPASMDLAPYPFEEKRGDLEKLYSGPITEQLEVSYALYPKVVRDYLAYRTTHGDASLLDTETFLYGLEPDREVLIDIEPGKTLVVKRTALGELREDDTREVHFNLNGQPRFVYIEDRSVVDESARRAKADPTNDHHIGAPMPGSVLSVAVKTGDSVKEGDALCVLEAMKLETTVRAPTAGMLEDVLVNAGGKVEPQDLLFVLK